MGLAAALAMALVPASSTLSGAALGQHTIASHIRLPALTPHPVSLDEPANAFAELERLQREAEATRARQQAARRAARALAPTACPAPTKARAAVFTFPFKPRAQETVRVVAIAWTWSELGSFRVTQGGKELPVTSKRRWFGPPYALEARVKAPRVGKLDVRLLRRASNHTTACISAAVQRKRYKPPRTADFAEVWRVTRAWDRWTEALFGAWIARLFYVPQGGVGSWFPLHQVTRDSSRNWLHNALGRAEDDSESKAKVILMPDCGDTPYFLRAYFAWKLGLPFMYRRCSRGNAVTGPRCPVARNNLVTKYARVWNPVRRFNAFVRQWVGWAVHSGTTRTLASADRTDFYPVALTRRAVRPGRIFVDPAGHVFVLSQQHAGSRTRLGVLFGIDGHPDRTISRKRFSKGTFVFNARYKTGGFKAFRPVVYADKRMRQLTNAEIQAHPEYGDLSEEQTRQASNQAFYDTVEKALNPVPMRPTQVYRSKILALYEAVQERVKAVSLGETYMKRRGLRTMAIPKGPRIFETTGPWERYSTPARDLRLLMAIQDVLDFPRTLHRRRHLYRIPRDWSRARLHGELQKIYRTETARLRISYVRTNRTVKSLTLGEVIERRKALRMGYNPNDCIEIRWGAPAGSAERSTCRRRALKVQRDKMRRYRVWFQLLRRPALDG